MRTPLVFFMRSTLLAFAAVCPASAKDIPNLTEEQMMQLISTATSQILVYSPYINNPNVAEGIRLARLKRGADVYYITTKEYLNSKLNAYTMMFSHEKMNVRMYAPKLSNLNAQPFIVIDQQHVIRGDLIMDQSNVVTVRNANYTNNPKVVNSLLGWFQMVTSKTKPVDNHVFFRDYFKLRN